ncbi:hypothetical protein [Nocardia carnea]|uniref:hypothetical protein n=1 Tax=Nocardia carnea TaxID=37328 RepID=UPI002454D8E7|nr:hypothetical protein [Nocardia carnea]
MTASAAASAAIDAVLEAIAKEARRFPGPEMDSRLNALAKVLDSLTAHVNTKEVAESARALADIVAMCTPTIRPTVETFPLVNESGPQVVAVDPDAIALLEGYGDGTVLEFRDGSIWDKSIGYWWTTGSEASLTSDDLAARGHWRTIRAR